jgi:polyhydroxyalkanoate synthase subunit PhaC
MRRRLRAAARHLGRPAAGGSDRGIRVISFFPELTGRGAAPAVIDGWWLEVFAAGDALRQIQAEFFGRLGLAPRECRYRVLASGPHWRLRAYAPDASGPSLLIVSAPIKKPYIWDISRAASVIRYCLDRGLTPYLIEWVVPPTDTDMPGLDRYIQAVHEAVACIAREHAAPPLLMGHSLGGTLAAVAAALEPDGLRGLVLLGSPLCFRAGTSRFGDALAALLPSALADERVMVPGSLISQLSVWASPETFVWSRLADAALSASDPKAAALHARVERWTLDEAPISGRLVGEIARWLYREDRFCREALVVQGRTIGPSRLRVPTLAVVNTSDAIVTPDSMLHFLRAAPAGYVQSMAYAGEIGVGFQHVALLIGRKARAKIWPAILSWAASAGTGGARKVGRTAD